MAEQHEGYPGSGDISGLDFPIPSEVLRESDLHNTFSTLGSKALSRHLPLGYRDSTDPEAREAADSKLEAHYPALVILQDRLYNLAEQNASEYEQDEEQRKQDFEYQKYFKIGCDTAIFALARSTNAKLALQAIDLKILNKVVVPSFDIAGDPVDLYAARNGLIKTYAKPNKETEFTAISDFCYQLDTTNRTKIFPVAYPNRGRAYQHGAYSAFLSLTSYAGIKRLQNTIDLPWAA